jgi:hypothetical protein
MSPLSFGIAKGTGFFSRVDPYRIINMVNISSGVSVTNNNTSTLSMNCTSGTSAWNQSAVSNEALTAPITIEFNVPQTGGPFYKMIGFTESFTTSMSYTVGYYLYPYQQSGGLTVYELGTNFGTSLTSWSAAQLHKLTYGTDGVIRYYLDATQIRSVSVGTGRSFRLGTAWYSTGGAITNLRWRQSI